MKWLVLLALALSGCSTPQWEKVMAAKDKAPGHYEEGGCRTWAKGVQARLDFPTHRFAWTAKGGDTLARHEVLAYNVGDEVWMMDNFSLGPKWVGTTKDSVEEMAMQFYSPARVRIENIRIDES